MRFHVSTIDRIKASLEEFNPSERRVADAILAHIEEASRGSIKALAEAAGTSQPTVMRFARRIGCAGFADLKRRLSQDFAIARMFSVADGDATLPHDPEVVAQQVYESTTQALAYAFTQRDPVAFDRAANAIVAAPRVFCFGVGGSSANIAEEAENRLFRYDVHAAAITDSYRQRVAAGLCDDGDVFLIFSVTGQPHSLVESAETAGALGGTIISVTRPYSPLAAASTIVVPLDVPDHEKYFEIPHRTRYAQLYILDCIAALVGGRRVERSAPKLRRIRGLLGSLHGGETEQQPIGD
jgi:RpiR family carbohydrate utilization transcriptional regulator